MTPERWGEIVSILQPALERPAEERAAFLDEACGSDTALRAEVESFLASAGGDDAFLETPASDAAFTTAADDLLARVQSALGSGYRVERELSGGGMSRVFLAQDARLGRRVVVKVLPAALGASLDVERFRREVRVAASLRHPHIVPLLDAGESADGLVYYTMPFIEGESLRRRLDRERTLPVPEVVRIVREVADALAYAHRQGVVHRDVKPGNVLVDGDHVVVADFGIAKAVASGERRVASAGERRVADAPQSSTPHVPLPTLHSQVIGTPGYMSPEQARGDRDVDGRSDVYSLGCLAFEMLTGERPFASSSTLASDVSRVLARAVSERAADRYATTTELADALAVALGGGRATRRVTRRRLAIGVGVVGAGIAALLWAAPFWRNSGGPIPGAVQRPTVAVLPFENLGRPEDGYFADGVANELTSRLGNIRRLRVISRTSARQYKGTTRPMKDVGRELGADYVIEGTVQWERPDSGRGRVRVHPRLVKVSDDSEVWSDRFDTQVADVFAVQGAISERVAAALEVAVPGGERTTLITRPTNDFDAYTYYLRAEEIRSIPDAERRRQAIALYDSALQRDPKFALALAKRSLLHSGAFRSFTDRSAARLERAREDAEAAIGISAILPEAQLALGDYYSLIRDWTRALDHFGVGLADHPDHPELLAARGNALARMGKLREGAQLLEQASALDPRSSATAREVAHVYVLAGDFPSAERFLRRAAAIDPGAALVYSELARLYINWRGDVAAASRVIREAPPQVSRAEMAARLCADAPLAIPPGAVWDSVFAHLDAQNFGAGVGDYMLCKAYWSKMRGPPSMVRVYADSARRAFEQSMRGLTEEDASFGNLAVAQALLGMKAEARRGAARAVELLPIAADAHDGAWILLNQAEVFLHLGDYEEAVSVLERLLGVPSEVSEAYLGVHPMWSPLRASARFERLVARGRNDG